jgi:Zn-dependent M28 family amino/carboxypeptidase
MVSMARIDAQRCARLLSEGKQLQISLTLKIRSGGPYPLDNVIGEIPGSDRKDEVVVIGAHLDSWDLGTGANDNGCNVSMMIDLARQMKRLGIVPRRTIRFALWNGEEQGLYGSMGYTQNRAKEMEKHVMAMSVDIGSGRITGFFTGGRPEVKRATERALQPVAGLGPFTNIDIPIVGTDNFDFMMHGVGNLVGNHEPSVYGPTYHAHSDTYDKVDLKNLKINSAIVAAVALGFANMEVDWKQQSRPEVERLVSSTDLEAQMKMFGIWDQWIEGRRGRK